MSLSRIAHPEMRRLPWRVGSLRIYKLFTRIPRPKYSSRDEAVLRTPSTAIASPPRFLWVASSLGKQTRHIASGLCQKIAKTGNFRLEDIPWSRITVIARLDVKHCTFSARNTTSDYGTISQVVA
jgi:hypothetical protein